MPKSRPRAQGICVPAGDAAAWMPPVAGGGWPNGDSVDASYGQFAKTNESYAWASSDISDGPRAVDDRAVWIGRVPPSARPREEVGKRFDAAFGQVTHVHIQSDLQCGFVHFASRDSAIAAVYHGSTMVSGSAVKIQKAVVKEKRGQDDTRWECDEALVKWEGRFESFRRGHGFLRPLGHGEASGQEGLERGVYVSPSQVEKFGLKNCDAVVAFVRPPRLKEERRELPETSGHRSDESSWALRKILSVNTHSAKMCDRGPLVEFDSSGGGDRFEWVGKVELFRQGAHGFLRPTDEDPFQLRCETSDRVGPTGVYVPAEAIAKNSLFDNDIVLASVCPPRPGQGPSFLLLDVLEVSRCADANPANSHLPTFLGVFESYKIGYGFIRPLDLDNLPEDWLRKGAYMPLSLVQRFGVRNRDRVAAKVRPPGKGQKSGTVTCLLAVNEVECDAGDGKRDIWSLLLGQGDGHETPTHELPEEVSVLLGVRLHGVVAKVKGDHFVKYGFIQAEHDSVKEHIFFHPQSISSPPPNWGRFMPHAGNKVFFKVEARRTEAGKWCLLAVDLNFHERASELKNADHRHSETNRPEEQWDSRSDLEVRDAWKNYWEQCSRADFRNGNAGSKEKQWEGGCDSRGHDARTRGPSRGSDANFQQGWPSAPSAQFAHLPSPPPPPKPQAVTGPDLSYGPRRHTAPCTPPRQSAAPPPPPPPPVVEAPSRAGAGPGSDMPSYLRDEGFTTCNTALPDDSDLPIYLRHSFDIEASDGEADPTQSEMPYLDGYVNGAEFEEVEAEVDCDAYADIPAFEGAYLKDPVLENNPVLGAYSQGGSGDPEAEAEADSDADIVSAVNADQEEPSVEDEDRFPERLQIVSQPKKRAKPLRPNTEPSKAASENVASQDRDPWQVAPAPSKPHRSVDLLVTTENSNVGLGREEHVQTVLQPRSKMAAKPRNQVEEQTRIRLLPKKGRTFVNTGTEECPPEPPPQKQRRSFVPASYSQDGGLPLTSDIDAVDTEIQSDTEEAKYGCHDVKEEDEEMEAQPKLEADEDYEDAAGYASEAAGRAGRKGRRKFCSERPQEEEHVHAPESARGIGTRARNLEEAPPPWRAGGRLASGGASVQPATAGNRTQRWKR